MKRFASAWSIVFVCFGATAFAQELPLPESQTTKSVSIPSPRPAPRLFDLAQDRWDAIDGQVRGAEPPSQIVLPAAPPPDRRPSPLVPLYVSFGTLQALDIHSTRRALDRGAVEANPLMKGVAGNGWALGAVKAAGAAGVIYATEKMWKKNRKAAVIFMVAANAGMAFVVQHNYRAGR